MFPKNRLIISNFSALIKLFLKLTSKAKSHLIISDFFIIENDNESTSLDVVQTGLVDARPEIGATRLGPRSAVACS